MKTQYNNTRSPPIPVVLKRNSQELSVWLCAGVQEPLGLLPGDLPVVPGHLLMSRGGDQPLQLRSVADDRLLYVLLLLDTSHHTSRTYA